MKLMTKEIASKLPPIGSTETQQDPLVVCKFFDPCGSWTWFVLEGNLETGELFGLVHGFEKEMGYFDLNELQGIKGRLGLGLERDRSWKPVPLSKVKSGEVS